MSLSLSLSLSLLSGKNLATKNDAIKVCPVTCNVCRHALEEHMVREDRDNKGVNVKDTTGKGERSDNIPVGRQALQSLIERLGEEGIDPFRGCESRVTTPLLVSSCSSGSQAALEGYRQ